ncbi:DUF4118 domain-containing protein [Legionella cardiaca]|uniref:histidine kinase n=1 Tax=Legionella cardiaca TaxID=1071983 RepID=A0ABY8AWU7_9GAMM|nr:DUF4118 domain-containing protein [Legionella cardiaca]WED43632.1 DUF4118 domain-containing protein [Legionella cardiaca]
MVGMDDQRPDPDVLLAKVQSQEKEASQGKLRIYFGASAGVGKTYAMLTEAKKLKLEGCDVVVGLVETHGRKETESLLLGLPVLPRQKIHYRGKNLLEFDIDAALKRKPQLILVDELAHSNISGTRHPKRWQDIEELLNAGIDVFTTLNVQHLESLNDVVGGITNIHISETVPDTIFDKADEVVMVDITAEDLLLRLKAGKVYQGSQGELAQKNFFRKGNLIALRELALRRTAERLEEDVQAYRIEQSIDNIWKTDTDLLVCIGERPGAEYIIRSTARLASQLNASWHVIYVETPELMRLSESKRQYALKALELAEELGATTSILTGDDIALAIIDYARSQNFSKIVLGRRSRFAWPWHRSLISRLATHAPDLDLLILSNQSRKGSGNVKVKEFKKRQKRGYLRYLIAILASFFTIIATILLDPFFNTANLGLLCLLTILLVAIRFGRGPAFVSSLITLSALDFLFVTPRYSFYVANLQYVIMLIMMLLIALITGYLTSNLRYQIFIKGQRESRTHVLYNFARELSSALQIEPILETTRVYIQHAFNARALLLLPDNTGHLQLPANAKLFFGSSLKDLDIGIAQWAFDHKESAGYGTDTLPGNSFFYLPLVAPMRTRGLLVIKSKNIYWIKRPEERQQLDTFAALAAIALERVHFIQVAQEALVHIESERMRNSLLAALSFDLQTPLASMHHLSDSLLQAPSTPLQQELTQALKQEVLRMEEVIKNLLEMARIKSGDLKLNLQWCHFEEIILKVIHSINTKITTHPIDTLLEENLPLVYLDDTLIERVLATLLVNTCKYLPVGTNVVLAVTINQDRLTISVYDRGPVLSIGQAKIILENFKNGLRVDLEVAICGAIIEAHGGAIHLGNSPMGGNAIVCTIPLRPAPELVVGSKLA